MKKSNIYAVEHVNQRNKKQKILELLKMSGFYEMLARRDKNALILLKCNFTPTSQKEYKYYTDPKIVNVILSEIVDRGYKNVHIAESETHFSDAFPDMTPENTARVLGFKGNVINLTKDKRTKFDYKDGSIELSNTMIKAAKQGFLINCPFAKNHEVFVMTACLKNIYGSIPAKNKFTLFHQRKSKLDVPMATHLANLITKPHYNFVDFIQGVDGDERALFYTAIKPEKRGTGINPFLNEGYYPSGMLIAGNDGLAIDKFISVKMGYKQNESPIVKYHAEETGDFDINDTNIIGSSLDPLPKWKKVSWLWLIHGMIEHQLPVNEDTIARGIRNYYFDKELSRKKSDSHGHESN
jgi:uncharacterized protein (DUF362 family)